MSDLSDSQRYDSGEGAFPDESKKSDSFIPTSMSEDEAPVARAREGSFSMNEIDKMVQELAELVTLEVRDSESTVSAQGYLVHTRLAPDTEVKEMGEDFKLPDCDMEDKTKGEGSETDSVDNAQLNEPFSYEDLVSRVKKSNFQHLQS
uniref:Uncharacterized protein n=1 Tax=Cannabis sativa TaxID=3483 RepID=A0A803QNJ7_CANSA